MAVAATATGRHVSARLIDVSLYETALGYNRPGKASDIGSGEGTVSVMRVHVTGATGYLGTELVRLAPAATRGRVEVRDREAVAALLERVRPDVVIHTAYRQDGDGAREIVVDGSENIARAVVDVGARLVHLSSDVVFDGRKGGAYLEEDMPSPCTDYGQMKADAEERVLGIAPDAVLVRTSLIVGGPGHVPSKHELVAHDSSATFYENEIRSPIQVGDLAAALLELASLDVSGPLNVAGGDAVSRAELAELIVGHAVRRAEAPPGRPLDCTLDSTRAVSLLRSELRGVRAVFA
ncbi:sugar nucleotide-binding protein [Gaiella sp.]|uniref:SDR family oxidoreductase n=1 Tax=Gaiella sp. TaxID=2663207 RepID=UPI003267B061